MMLQLTDKAKKAGETERFTDLEYLNQVKLVYCGLALS